MDKLVNYIEYRWKRYGEIERAAALSSIYYHFGNIQIRISDHMKYNEDAIKKIDYFFIIQPNDTYIFIPNPKYNKDGKLYMKDDTYKIKVAYRIENLVYGNIGKGSLSEKMDRIKNAYMKMSSSQYKTLMKNFNRAKL